MFVLIIGIVIFFGVHLIPLTSSKVNLVERMGEKKYQGVYSIIDIVLSKKEVQTSDILPFTKDVIVIVV